MACVCVCVWTCVHVSERVFMCALESARTPKGYQIGVLLACLSYVAAVMKNENM